MGAVIARLEAATEGSHALDVEIAAALGWRHVPGYGHQLGWWAEPGGAQHTCLPDWTESLDAALTLVPEGHAWIVEDTVGQGCGPGRMGIGACVWNCPHEPPIYRAETVALALCIAALMARA